MFVGFITKSRLQTTQDDKLVKEFWWEKCRMATEIVQILHFYFKRVFIHRHSKSLFLQVTLIFELKWTILLVDIITQICDKDKKDFDWSWTHINNFSCCIGTQLRAFYFKVFHMVICTKFFIGLVDYMLCQ